MNVDTAVLVALISASGVLGAAVITRPARRHTRVLAEINHAVNNVGFKPDGTKADPLWQRVDRQTEIVGEMKGLLAAHAEQDSVAQTALGRRIDETHTLIRAFFLGSK